MKNPLDGYTSISEKCALDEKTNSSSMNSNGDAYAQAEWSRRHLGLGVRVGIMSQVNMGSFFCLIRKSFNE